MRFRLKLDKTKYIQCPPIPTRCPDVLSAPAVDQENVPPSIPLTQPPPKRRKKRRKGVLCRKKKSNKSYGGVVGRVPRDKRHSQHYNENKRDILRRKQRRYDRKPLAENINLLNQQRNEQRQKLQRVLRERNTVETAFIKSDCTPTGDVVVDDTYDCNDDIPKKRRRYDAEQTLELLNIGYQTGTAKNIPAVIAAVVEYQRQNGIRSEGTPVPSTGTSINMMGVMPKVFSIYQCAVMLRDGEMSGNLCIVRDGGSYKGRMVTSSSACCKDPEKEKGMKYLTLGMPQVCAL